MNEDVFALGVERLIEVGLAVENGVRGHFSSKWMDYLWMNCKKSRVLSQR